MAPCALCRDECELGKEVCVKDNKECPICLEIETDLVKLLCGHHYCSPCWKLWSEQPAYQEPEMTGEDLAIFQDPNLSLREQRRLARISRQEFSSVENDQIAIAQRQSLFDAALDATIVENDQIAVAQRQSLFDAALDAAILDESGVSFNMLVNIVGLRAARNIYDRCGINYDDMITCANMEPYYNHMVFVNDQNYLTFNSIMQIIDSPEQHRISYSQLAFIIGHPEAANAFDVCNLYENQMITLENLRLCYPDTADDIFTYAMA
jgi:hypothetical protein